MGYVIGIDIGTGSTKAVAVNYVGKIIETSQVSYPILEPEPTFSEQEPEAIWHSFIKCIEGIINTLGDQPSAIVLGSAMHSLIPIDGEGKPLMNMITWADNRSALVAERVRRSQDGEILYEETGTPIHAMSPLCKILWLKENATSLFNQASRFVSIKEYIWFKLFGVYEVDFSIASATGLFNINRNEWNDRSLKVCGIRATQLSKAVPTDYRREGLQRGIADLLSIKTDTPFIVGASDGCLANLGSFAIESGTAALTIGTSGAIRVATHKPSINFRAMTFNYRLFDNVFISGGPINNGGIALKWYAESFLKISLASPSDYDKLLDAIDTTPAGSNGLIFLPYLLGERAPIWNSQASGAFFGIRNYHSQTHFTRAVIEGISMALYSIMNAMESSGLAITKVHVSGGFVHSEGWLQILADVFNKPIVLIHDEDASAIGATFLGLKVLGLIKEYSDLNTMERNIFLPKAENHAVYKLIFKVYQNLYEKLCDDMATLAQFRS
ncbi:MAG: gluconokinase [Chryseolinea sp.]